MSKQVSAHDASCTEKCRFRGHGHIITSAITKRSLTDYQLACYISSICKNYAQVLDNKGRNALHVAASCGRRDLCYWLIKAGKGDINTKDEESGYTPLHRSILYGHINNAVTLIEMGAQVHIMDKDDLWANDHAMKDKLIKELSVRSPCQVYVWGTNNNYNLGIGNQHSRSQPEMLDYFRKHSTSITQVAMDKFHSVFVSSSGRAWSCGHGQGGRLGIESEKTVLTPQPIKTGSEVVVAASVGRNHTVLLMESGTVSTCGWNAHHVLGHAPPPPALLCPRPLLPRSVKAAGLVVGVVAATYTSALWSHTSLLTWGLNAGQLGHPMLQEKTIITPKQVTGLSLGPNGKIVDVAASVGAIVVSVSKGDIYVLHNYQIRRIASKMLDVTKVSVIGGELNPDMDQKLTPRGGEELKVMVLTSTGNVLLWQESFPQLTRCIYPLKRSLTFCGLSLCLSNVLLITKDGEAYIGHVKPKAKKKAIAPSPKTESMSFNQFVEKLDCHHMTINRVPHIHRAVDVAADPKGRNFVVIQENPKVNLTDIPVVEESEISQQMAALLEDAHEDDLIHDVIFQVDYTAVAAHHFVLARSSDQFASTPRSGSVTVVKCPGTHIQVLNQVLTFAYTYDCDIIHPGPFLNNIFNGDIIKAAHELAKKIKMPILIKCLQLLRYEEGLILLREGDSPAVSLPPLTCERTTLPSLLDVTITSNDGASFRAHKCVLAARLEYFNSMFSGGWAEAEAMNNLSLPIPQTILREILDFLYQDEAPALAESQDVDYISSVLVVTDQLFIKKLKQICEVALSGNLSLRNTAYLLQLAITYNADQLKSCCMQFICLNLAAILETRILEILDSETLEELSRYYRNMTPIMCKRIMTPFYTPETEDEMIETANNYPITWVDSEDFTNASKVNRSNPTPTPKRKTIRPRKSSESQRKRFESVSSNSDLDLSIDLTPTEKIDFDELVERNQPHKKEEWVRVDKVGSGGGVQKVVQERLKSIVKASSVQPTPQDFTCLNLTGSSSPLQTPIRDGRHFPQLSSPPKASPSPKPSSVEIKWSPLVKMSQKQRKRLQAEGGGAGGGGAVISGVMKEEQSVPTRSPWAVLPSPTESLVDIMKSALTVGSPPTSEQKFSDIVAEEIQQRDNWSKMKSKSLQLTQIEDKAMEDLRVFYNAANVFDERITVERVLSANIAKPIWITSRHQ